MNGGLVWIYRITSRKHTRAESGAVWEIDTKVFELEDCVVMYWVVSYRICGINVHQTLANRHKQLPYRNHHMAKACAIYAIIGYRKYVTVYKWY